MLWPDSPWVYWTPLSLSLLMYTIEGTLYELLDSLLTIDTWDFHGTATYCGSTRTCFTYRSYFSMYAYQPHIWHHRFLQTPHPECGAWLDVYVCTEMHTALINMFAYIFNIFIILIVCSSVFCIIFFTSLQYDVLCV